MPPPGSILVPLRFNGGGMIAIARASEAGWTSQVLDLHAPEMNVTFSRYVGVATPDAETQARHIASLKQALAADGMDIGDPQGLVRADGQTHPVLATAQLISVAGPEVRAQVEAGRWRGDGLGSVEGVKFAGTCFAFRHANVFLTAAHCVAGHEPDALLIVTPGFPAGAFPVARVTRHSTADLAILELDDQAWPAVEPFVEVAPAPPLGAEFMAYGFPEDAPPPDQAEHEPVQRFFRGYVQRKLQYELPPFKFSALEMSIPSPSGLSGGPLFTPTNFNGVIGLATQNVESTTYVGRHEEVVDGEKTFSSTDVHHVQYGIAALLAPHLPWLEELVPARVRMPREP